ncbi:TetR family transcriptional regulator [Rhodococcus opacus PD630]|uniref:TetR/AcrR family transcriptional regulator n=1 Tax=Rhodococcus opacus TaxID=37919 RepID=UPI00029CB091|nr:TetR/AcrR family transcriptional regulator [Rhodococcus opacus]AHK29108.1 HTH-type transcriptional regulator ttgR [Rhodococcus opacus PD630]EHI43842.1 TetR family transcriptional regulator [Rhodococcus opacus PD630]UDG98919.1 TetR/AcrR family transcriptional regulator [Rhodococcus opacus PD630]
MLTQTNDPGGAEHTARPMRGPGRPVGDHEEKRAELLRAATSVIAEQGFARASLRKVAERAGYTTGAVTYYFANKSDLVHALAESRFDRYDTLLDAVAPEADIRGLLQQWLEMSVGEPEFSQVMSQLLANTQFDAKLRETIARRYASYRARFADVVREGQRRGTIRDDVSAVILVDQIGAMGDGLAIIAPLEPHNFGADKIEQILDGVIRLISPP